MENVPVGGIVSPSPIDHPCDRGAPLPTETTAARARRPRIIRLPEPARSESFAEAVRRGLRGRPKSLPCRFLYDAEGSLLFERICSLPEYYLTRTEDAILRVHADPMVAIGPRPPTLIELGSGSSTKTRRLIAAALGTYGGLHYVPIDVSATILEESARALLDEFPGLRVTGFAADYRADALVRLAARLRGPKLLVFLGSSLGNFEDQDAIALLGQFVRAMGPADRLLLGTDLDKAPATIEAAYDDAQGISARFNLNLLDRINRELGGDFDRARFAHRARYRRGPCRVAMHLVSLVDQVVRIPGASLTAHFQAGETIHTENSHKYTIGRLHDLARLSGFVEEAAWNDPDGLFRVQRWRLRGGPAGA
jgi:L-histidine N-alpha-methyltransferase